MSTEKVHSLIPLSRERTESVEFAIPDLIEDVLADIDREHKLKKVQQDNFNPFQFADDVLLQQKSLSINEQPTLQNTNYITSTSPISQFLPLQPHTYVQPITMTNVNQSHTHHPVPMFTYNNNNNNNDIKYKSKSPKSTTQITNSNNNNQSNKKPTTDPLQKLRTILTEKDEDQNGEIDIQEFTEAIHDIDPNIIESEIESIYNSQKSNKNELNISIFLKHLKTHENNALLLNNTNLNSNDSSHSVTSNKSPISALSTPGIMTPKGVLRNAYPDVFSDNEDDDNEHIWGVKQMSSMDRLKREMVNESENGEKMDFPEFEAVVCSLGVEFDKNELKSIFSHFLGEQMEFDDLQRSNNKNYKLNHKKYDLNIDFVINKFKFMNDNYFDLTPKQIIKNSIDDLLKNPKKLNKRSSFKSNKKSNMIGGKKSYKIPINPMMGTINDDSEMDDTSDLECNMSGNDENDDDDDKQRYLLRMQSSAKWNDNAMDVHRKQMEEALKRLTPTQSGSLMSFPST